MNFPKMKGMVIAELQRPGQNFELACADLETSMSKVRALIRPHQVLSEAGSEILFLLVSE